MFVAFPVFWFSLLIAVCFTAIGIGCTIAELQGKLQIRQTVRNVGACLKYEVVELPFPVQERATLPAAPVTSYRVMKTVDQYICPVCKCPAVCSGHYQSLDPEQEYAPRLYDYRCLSGHVYHLRFKYDIWKSYKRVDHDAYVLVQKNKRLSCS